MIEALEKENLKIPIVPVVAAEKEFGIFIISSSGLEKLILIMKDCLSSIIYHTQSNGNIVSIIISANFSWKLFCFIRWIFSCSEWKGHCNQINQYINNEENCRCFW